MGAWMLEPRSDLGPWVGGQIPAGSSKRRDQRVRVLATSGIV